MIVDEGTLVAQAMHIDYQDGFLMEVVQVDYPDVHLKSAVRICGPDDRGRWPWDDS